MLAWPLVCGAGVAAHTEAVSQADNRLRVIVPDATWKSQLQDFVPQYIHAMQQMTGIRLERINFEVAGSKRPQRGER